MGNCNFVEYEYKVIIRCLVYNHEPYLRDCLNGIVLQKTNFPFKAVVHDDCSTDNSAAIIREYAERYPEIIEPVYATENRYSRGLLESVMASLTETSKNEYTAWCEGDDYWIDPNKLQKQVDFLDTHPNYVMICSNAEVENCGQFLTSDDLSRMSWPCYSKSRKMSVEDIIRNGGWFIHSCTILYRSFLKEDYPPEARYCSVGDYPLQIFAALKGDVFYLHEKTAVYRFASPGSWTERSSRKASLKDVASWVKIIRMLEALNKYSAYMLNSVFKDVIRKYITDLVIENPDMLESVCYKVGYVFLSDYMPHNNERKSLKKRIKAQMVNIKWYPFAVQKLCVLLKKKSLIERFRLARICAISGAASKKLPE